MATKIVNVMAFGDSTVGNYQMDPGPTHPASREGWTYLANASSNFVGKVNLNSQGMDGMALVDQLNRIIVALPFFSPFIDIVMCEAWSKNDINLDTQLAAQKTNILAAQSAVQTAGLGFIPFILAPLGAASQTTAYVTAYNNLKTWLKSTYPTTFWDTSALVADPASPTNWLAANSGDNVHPSSSGGSPIIAASANTNLYSIIKNVFGYTI